MKTFALSFLLLASAQAAPPPAPQTPQQIAAKIARMYAQAHDPYRIIDGKTNSILAAGFVAFNGKVVGVDKGGIRVDGYLWFIGDSDIPQQLEFYVAHFPYQVADDDEIGTDPEHLLFAKLAPNHQYDTAIGGSRTIHALDYGLRCGPPARPPQKPRDTNAPASKN